MRQALTHLRVIGGLGKHAIHAAVAPLLFMQSEVTCGVGHHWNRMRPQCAALVLADSRRCVQAVHQRHFDIHQHDVELLFFSQQHGSVSVTGNLRHDSPTREQGTREQLLKRAIIDQQDTQGRSAGERLRGLQ